MEEKLLACQLLPEVEGEETGTVQEQTLIQHDLPGSHGGRGQTPG